VKRCAQRIGTFRYVTRLERKQAMRKVSLTILSLFAVLGVATAQRWHAANIPAPYNQGFYLDVFFLPSDPSYGWACDNFAGYVVRTTNGGATWRGTQIGGVGCHLEYIQFLNTQVGYCSGPCGIFKSTDGGATWSADLRPDAPNRPSVWGGWFRDANTGWFVGGNCNEKIFLRTDDGGATFNTFTSTAGDLGKMADPLWQPDMPAGHVYAIGGGTMWRSVDDGLTWSPAHVTGPTRPWHEELARSGSSWLIPNCQDQCDPASTNGMRFSPDNGATIRQTNTSAQMFGSFLLDANTGWTAGFNWNVWYTADAGVSWQRRACGIPVGTDLDDIFMIDANRGWVAGGGAGLYYLGPPTAQTDKRDIYHIDRCLGREYRDTIYVSNINFTAATASATLLGTNANQFRIVEQIPASIPSCGTERVVVVYAPTTQGPHSASLSIALQNPDTTIAIPLFGETRGVTSSLRSDRISFDARVGRRESRVVEFVALGLPYESVLAINQLTGDNQIILVSRTPLPNQIGPGSLQLVVEANLRDTGTYEATFRVTLGPCLRDTVIHVRVTGRTPIIKTTTSLRSSSQCRVTDTLFVPVSNTGNDVLSIGRLLITGQGASAFIPLYWTSGTQLPGSIPAKMSDTLVLLVRPYGGDERAQLAIEHDDWSTIYGSRNPWIIDLSSASNLHHVRFAPSVIQFDTVCLGSTAEITLSASNTGATPASITVVHSPEGVTGLPSGAVEVVPLLTRRWTLRFSPQRTGVVADSIVLRLLPCDSVIVLPVYGVAVEGGIRFTPRTIVVSLTEGTSIADVVATIAAEPSGPVTVRNVRIEPLNPQLRIVGPTVPFVLADSTGVQLTWNGSTPDASYVGLLIAESDAPCQPNDTIPVRIRQIPADAINIDVRAEDVVFLCGDTIGTAEVVIANLGGENVALTDWVLPAHVQVTGLNATGFVNVANGASVTVSIVSTRKAPAVDTIRFTAIQGNRQQQSSIVLTAVEKNTLVSASMISADSVEVDRCQPPFEWVVDVSNAGTIPARISVDIVGGTPGIAVVDAQQTIASGETVKVRVEAIPSALPEGVAYDVVRITDETCGRQYLLPIAVNTIGGTLSVAPRAIDLGSVPPLQEVQAVVYIENLSTSNRTLQRVSLANDGALWRIVQAPPVGLTMVPGDIDSVVVSWRSSVTVDHIAFLSIFDEGTCNVEHRIPLRARSVVVPPQALLVPLQYDHYNELPYTTLEVPLRLTANITQAEVDSLEILTLFSNLVYDVTEVLPGELEGVSVVSTIEPGRVTMQVVRANGFIGGPGIVAVLRGEARPAIPDSTALRLPRVVVRSTQAATAIVQEGSVTVDVCGPRFMIRHGGLAAVRVLPPVPSAGLLQLEVTAYEADNIAVGVVDVQGRTVAQITVRIEAGSTVVPLDLSQVGSGVYQLRCRGNGGGALLLPIAIVR